MPQSHNNEFILKIGRSDLAFQTRQYGPRLNSLRSKLTYDNVDRRACNPNQFLIRSLCRSNFCEKRG